MHSASLPVSALLLLITILINCCTNASKEKTFSQPGKDSVISKADIPGFNKQEPAAPGTAKIKARMQDFSEEDDQYSCKLKVEEVNSYGPATPPLPQGYVLHAFIPRELLKKNNYPGDKIFIRGKLLQMTVGTRGRMPGSDTLMLWTVMSFENLK